MSFLKPIEKPIAKNSLNKPQGSKKSNEAPNEKKQNKINDYFSAEKTNKPKGVLKPFKSNNLSISKFSGYNILNLFIMIFKRI